MNKKPMEKIIENCLIKACKNRGGKAVKLIPQNMAGIPDRMLLLPGGYLVFAELKREGEKPRALQEYQHRKLRELGFKVEVVDTKEKLEEVMRDYDLRAAWLPEDR